MRKTIEFDEKAVIEVTWKLPAGFKVPKDWKCKDGIITDSYKGIKKMELVSGEDAQEIESWVPNFEPDINHEYLVLTLNGAGDRKAFRRNSLTSVKAIVNTKEK